MTPDVLREDPASAFQYDFSGLPEEQDATPDAPPPETAAPAAASSALPLAQADDLAGCGLAGHLLHVTSSLASLASLEALLPQVTGLLVSTVPCVQVSLLWLYDARGGKLRLASYAGLLTDDDTNAALTATQLYPGDGVAGRVLHENTPLRLESTNGYLAAAGKLHPAQQHTFARMGDYLPRTLTVLATPLLFKDEPLGVLELLHVPPPEASTAASPADADASNDLPALPETLAPSSEPLGDLPRMLHTFAHIVAATIRDKRRFDELRRYSHRLESFDAVVTSISTATDLDDLLRNVLDVMLNLLPVSSGAIFLLDPAESRLSLGTFTGLPPTYVVAMHNILVAGSACEEVVRYGQPTMRPLLSERGEAVLLDMGLESCAYMPLLAGGTVVGVLALYGGAQLFSEIDMAGLMPLSNQVGIAIANVLLYEDSTVERQKLSMVVNSITEGVVLCDSQGRLLLANQAAMDLLTLDSVPYQQALSEMADFYGFRDLEGRPLSTEKLPMARALYGETFHDYRLLLHGASGKNSVMSFSGAPARSDAISGGGAVVVFRDFTAIEKLERAKDEFLAVAAHELRSPLAAVRSYAEMLLRRELQRGGEADSRDVRGLAVLSEQVAHMLRMVDNLLDVSRLDAGQLDLQLQTIDVVQLVQHVLDQQRPIAPQHELVLTTEQPELPIVCDSMRVRQVLTNLVNNAIKYSPLQSQITVSVSLRPATLSAAPEPLGDTTPDTALPTSEPTHEALLAISDTGGGIPAEQQVRLFQRYYRIKNRRAEGLGLGLYLSRQFVLMHGGRIWVESSEDIGSTFYFTLPIHLPEAVQEPPQP